MINQQEKTRTNQTVKEIRAMLDDLAQHPENHDTSKMAVEIYEMCQPRYSEPSWHHTRNILGTKIY